VTESDLDYLPLTIREVDDLIWLYKVLENVPEDWREPYEFWLFHLARNPHLIPMHHLYVSPEELYNEGEPVTNNIMDELDEVEVAAPAEEEDITPEQEEEESENA
jgi:hypothetical protein